MIIQTNDLSKSSSNPGQGYLKFTNKLANSMTLPLSPGMDK